MRWKQKALLQNLMAKLPSKLSYRLYEMVQMRFGAYRLGNNPFGRLEICAGYLRTLRDQGFSIEGKRVLEVGAGRSLLVPIGCWLCGAQRVVSVDLHPYLAEPMFIDDLAKIQAGKDELIATFGELAQSDVFKQRSEKLLGWDLQQVTVSDLLDRMDIDYQAPADAAALVMDDESVDLHVSVAVLEHIPAEILEKIFAEGVRVTKKGGWFVHRWDMSDHFSHKDHTITAINFLQFPQKQWSKYNDNRYMYVNRLRIDFFDGLFSAAGLKVKERQVKVDPAALQALQSGFATAVPFSDKPDEVNATTAATFYAQK